MCDYVADPNFLLQKKFERRIEQLYPDKYTPLYAQVSFNNIPYSIAYKNGKAQDAYIKKVTEQHNVQQLFETEEIDELIHSLFGTKTPAK